MPIPSSILDAYYADNDVVKFVHAVETHFELTHAFPLPDYSPLKRYLDLSKDPTEFYGPFEIWPAPLAFEKQICILDLLEIRSRERFSSFKKGIPIMKIGEASFKNKRLGGTQFEHVVDLWLNFSSPGRIVSPTRHFLLADIEDYLEAQWDLQNYDGRSELMEFIHSYGCLNVQQLLSIQYMLLCDFDDDVRAVLEEVRDPGRNEMVRSTEFVSQHLSEHYPR